MGLSASQARVLLLTSKNDALELQAQLISNERLLLAQEQERIANEYSDATGNEIWTCNVRDPQKDNEKGTSQKYMSLVTLAESRENQPPIYVKYGVDDDGEEQFYGIKASYNEEKREWSYECYKNGKELQGGLEEIPEGLRVSSKGAYASAMQVMARNNTLELYIPQDSDSAIGSVENALTFSVMDVGDSEDGDNTQQQIAYVKKAPESLSTVSSRYFTEDDAQAEAEYNLAMQKVNAIDKRLENKLNQIETQKKAVETEMESSKNLVKTNEERTFKYFS